METNWQQIILLSLLGWAVFAFLAAVAFGWWVGGHRNQEKEDRDQAEYLADYSDLKMLQRQAGGLHNVIEMRMRRK